MADELITSNHRRFTNIPIRMHEATALLYHCCFCLGVADGRISKAKEVRLAADHARRPDQCVTCYMQSWHRG